MPDEPVRVTLVHAPACHLCEDAASALAELAEQYPLQIRIVPLESEEGRGLTTLHRPALFPLVLVDDRYFSAGRLPRRKFVALLERRPAAAGSRG